MKRAVLWIAPELLHMATMLPGRVVGSVDSDERGPFIGLVVESDAIPFGSHEVRAVVAVSGLSRTITLVPFA